METYSSVMRAQYQPFDGRIHGKLRQYPTDVQMEVKLKKIAWLLACCLFGQNICAQVSDDFSDGNFSVNPIWSGEDTKFEILAGQLHLNDIASSGKAYLSTPSEAIANAEWSIYVEISENPSSTNYTSVYLVSDQADLANDLNGYFIKIGNTDDEVSLYRQDGSTQTKIIDGLDDRVNVKPVQIEIKVTRDASGNWALSTRPVGDINFSLEGSVQDDAYEVSNYFGVYCKYTATRKEAFYFDDISVTGTPQPDTEKPEIASLSVISDTQLAIQFSETVDVSTAETTTNYTLASRTITSAVAVDDNVTLTFAPALVNATDYTMDVSNIEDETGNVLADTTLGFFYFESVPAQGNDVIISELMPDPNPVKADLPDAEYIEIYNRSENPFDLEDWILNDKLLPSYILRPQQFVILCNQADSAAFAPFGEVLPLSTWPTLSNSGTHLVLKDNISVAIDSLTYTADEVEGGISLERIAEETPCDQRSNLALSIAERGGTPGQTNTVIANPDTYAPQLLEVQAADDLLQLIFDERVTDASLQPGFVQLQPEHTVVQVVRDSEDEKVLWATLANNLPANITYALTFLNAEDCYGNAYLSQSKAFYFDNQPPDLLRAVVRDTAEVELVFTEKINAELANDEDLYWLDDALVTPKTAKLSDDSLSVNLHFTSSLADEQVHQLTITQWEDQYGNAADTLTVDVKYQQDIDTVIVRSEYQLAVHFSDAVLPEMASKVSNHEIDRGVGQPHTAFIDSEELNVLHLVLAKSLTANREHELLVDQLRNQEGEILGTPIYRFYFDQSAPKLDSVQAVNERTLHAYFDEPLDSVSATNPLHYQIAQRVIQWARLSENQRSVELELDSALIPEQEYELEVLGIADLSGNVMSSRKSKTFVYDQHPPVLLSWKIVNPHELRLYFSESVLASSTAKYELDGLGLPDSVAVSQLRPNEVGLFFNASLSFEEAALTFSRVADLRGNSQNETSETIVTNTEAQLGQITVLSSTELRLDFTQNIQAEAMGNLARYSVSNISQPMKVDIIELYALRLAFDQSFQPEANYELSINEIVNKNNQTFSGTQDSFIYQTQISHIDIEQQAILLHFQVPLDSVIAVQNANYQLEQKEPQVALWIDKQTVRLIFKEAFQPLTRYELTLSGLRNIDSDIIPNSVHTVGLGRTPSFNELLITEIMADPLPAVGLPEVEYLELYNASDDLISINGLRLLDASSSTSLPSALLLPGEYLIVCANADQSELLPYGRAIGVSSFPSLNSSGDQISLTDSYGNEVFSVTYSDSWYNDVEKKQGGWSLEMIDYTRPCGEQNNWTASEDAIGGTPGKLNSVNQPNPDNQSPFLIESFAVSPTEVILQFNEKLDPTSFETGQIEFSNALVVDSVVWQPDLKTAYINLEDSLESKVTYSVRTSQLHDCSGNFVDGQEVSFVLSEEAVSGDILLSEILVYPRSGGVRFVEIYNYSDKPINLKGWQLANQEGDSLVNYKFITQENHQIAPQQYLALTEDETTLVGDYPLASQGNILAVEGLPDLPSGAGNFVLLSPSNEPMQLLEYDESWHHPVLDDIRGVSLERIQWEAPVNDPNNWQSAAQTAGFATPGYANSQSSSGISSSQTISVEPKVFTPDQDGFQDYTQIHYRWPTAGNTANVLIFDSQGRKVKHLARNTTLAEEGFLRWDGTGDAQQILPMGYYLIYFEVFHTNGQVSVLKEKVVVGHPF